MGSPILPTLESRRLLIRPYEGTDRTFFARLVSDPTTMRSAGGPLSAEESEALFERCLKASQGDRLEAWAIVSKTTDRPIGHVALKVDDKSDAREIIVILATRQWRKGFAGEAAYLVLGYAFETQQYLRVIATIDPDHEPSVGLAYKLGMSMLEHREDDRGRYPVYAIDRETWMT